MFNKNYRILYSVYMYVYINKYIFTVSYHKNKEKLQKKGTV